MNCVFIRFQIHWHIKLWINMGQIKMD